MDQSVKSARGRRTASSTRVPAEYSEALAAASISPVLTGVLFEAGVDPEYALPLLRGNRHAYDIVLLWKHKVDPEYALQFAERRDLTVLDIADRWECDMPAEFATVV